MNDEEQVPQARTPAGPADAGETPVEKLEGLGVRGILWQLARDGQLIDVRCEMRSATACVVVATSSRYRRVPIGWRRPTTIRGSRCAELRQQLDAIAARMGRVYGPMVVFAAATGLRPSELFGLEWRDIDRAGGVATRRARARAGGGRWVDADATTPKPHPTKVSGLREGDLEGRWTLGGRRDRDSSPPLQTEPVDVQGNREAL
jgi:hypothetical protein